MSSRDNPIAMPAAVAGLAALYLLAAILWFDRLLLSPAFIAASLVLAAALLALSFIDIRTQRLPDWITVPLLAAGLAAVALLRGLDQLPWHLAAAVVAYLLLHVLAEAYRRLRGEAGLGLGDAKLFAAAGAWVGPGGLASVLLVAAGSALLAVLVMRLAGRQVTRTTRLAFGPFLALGHWLVWIGGPLV